MANGCSHVDSPQTPGCGRADLGRLEMARKIEATDMHPRILINLGLRLNFQIPCDIQVAGRGRTLYGKRQISPWLATLTGSSLLLPTYHCHHRLNLVCFSTHTHTHTQTYGGDMLPAPSMFAVRPRELLTGEVCICGVSNQPLLSSPDRPQRLPWPCHIWRCGDDGRSPSGI